MIRYDLKCENGDEFEAWFGSIADYDKQAEAGQLVCPHCGKDAFIQRSIMLNTQGLTFLQLDWLNQNANVLECVECGRLEWFTKPAAPRSE